MKVSSNRYGNEDNISGNVSIRVPANRFSEAFIKLRTIVAQEAVRVLSGKLPVSLVNPEVKERITITLDGKTIKALEKDYLKGGYRNKSHQAEELLKKQLEKG